jgi:6-pyruvoyltetrahydropterin/6-carboxytetrahydropterin synthase
MYEVGTAADVRAFHVMPGMEGPEGELHSHDYRIEVRVETDELDERGMVCDLDVLDAALAGVVEHVREANLDIIRPDDAEAVTVEVFARWAHDTLSQAVGVGGGEVLQVRVWESPVAFAGYRAAL